MLFSSIHLLKTESSGGNISWKFCYCAKLSGLRLCELIKWSDFDNSWVQMVFFLHLSGLFFLFTSTAMDAGKIFPWFWAVQNLKECHEKTNAWQQNGFVFQCHLFVDYRTTHWRNIGILIGTQCAYITSQERRFTYQTGSNKLQLQGFKALLSHSDQEDDQANWADNEAQVEDNRAVWPILGVDI